MIIEVPNTVQYDFFKILIAAFSGAFAAYIFTEIAKYFERKYHELKKHKEALFKIDLMCNNMTDDIALNKYEFDQIKSRYERCLHENIILIPGNKPFRLQYDENILINLKNEEIMNDYYSLTIKLKRYNNDVQTINDSFAIFKVNIINETITKTTYLDNYKNYVSKAESVIKHLEGLQQKVFLLLAKARIVRMEKVGIRKILKDLLCKKSEISMKRIEEELAKMTNERADVKSKDKKFIENIIN